MTFPQSFLPTAALVSLPTAALVIHPSLTTLQPLSPLHLQTETRLQSIETQPPHQQQLALSHLSPTSLSHLSLM